MLKIKNYRLKTNRGFTLIELLIVIAIIAILAAVVLVALDPLTRFQDSRDARRWSDARNLLDAIKMDQVDNGGSYVYGVTTDTSGITTVVGDEYMISDATTTSGCQLSCSAVAASNDCVNLQDVVTEGYVGSLPISPNATGTWTSTYTGYYLIRNSTTSNTGTITIGACDAEGVSSITVTR